MFGDTRFPSPPSARRWPRRLLYGFGALGDAADRIDHTLPTEAPVPEAVKVEHGRYVAQMCIACHGPGFAGAGIPNAPPTGPRPPIARLAPMA